MFGLERSEEEKAQLLKDWLKRYTVVIIIGIVALFGSIAGYRYYNQDQQNTNRMATEILFDLIEMNNTSIAAIPTNDADTTADTNSANPATQAADLVASLESITTDGYILAMARIQHARILLAENAAYDAITQALSDTPSSEDPIIAATATLLLANAAWLNSNIEEALRLLEKPLHPAFAPLAHQLQGDIHLANGDDEKARNAYTQAVQGGLDSELLQLKNSFIAPVKP